MESPAAGRYELFGTSFWPDNHRNYACVIGTFDLPRSVLPKEDTRHGSIEKVKIGCWYWSLDPGYWMLDSRIIKYQGAEYYIYQISPQLKLTQLRLK